MAFVVVLDANVLYPFSLRDLLLRLAEQECFVHVWSERILDEMNRNLVENEQMDQERADRLTRVMREAFPEAEQDLDAIAAIEPIMANDEDDRHVLATAVVAGAEGIVTFNRKHFPDKALAPWGKQALNPDEFLCTVHDMYGDIVVQTVVDQAADLKSPPWTTEQLLDALHRGQLRKFANRIRDELGLPRKTAAQVRRKKETEEAGEAASDLHPRQPASE
jgi:predicted nucleic acid-binding protein